MSGGESETINSTKNVETDSSVKLLTDGFIELYEPPLKSLKNELKELVTKQNKIYVDISAEKFIFIDSDVNAVSNLIEQVKFYREKVIKIKKQMNQIHQKTANLKKKVQKIEKQCLEEASML